MAVTAPPGKTASGSNLAAQLRARQKQARAALTQHYLSRPHADTLLAGLSDAVDATLIDAWQALDLPRTYALVAVGGYGRGRLYPSSDVDVLVLLPEAESNTATVERFITLLWDCGLELGHSVRTVEQCAEEAKRDVTVDTALLESRLITGDRDLFINLEAALTAQRNVRDFFRAKIDEQIRRHARFQDAAYNLEPNIKESPGGLRDLQTVLWLSRAVGLGTDWRALCTRGLITRSEARDIEQHSRVLADLRIRLHLLSGRREDRLVFDHQTAIAEQLKLKTPLRAARSLRPSELLMRRYYLAAKGIWRYNTILLSLLAAYVAAPEERRVRVLDDHFQTVGPLLDVRDDTLFAREPGMMFEAFQRMQANADLIGLAPRLLRAMQRNLHRIDSAFRRDPANQARFLAILKSERLTWTLRRMSRYGVLGRFLPAFGRVVGQMQHDLFHVYTVDEHTLMLVRNLRRFAIARFAHEFPFCSELMRTVDRKEILYIAALFHDIAKGRGGDHSELGAKDARQYCRAAGINKHDTALITWLVEHHLSMSQTAQKRDLSDPDVVAEFAQLVETEERLILLYILTVADIRATSPKVWNAWKGKLLEDLFRATRALLRGEHTYNEAWIVSKKTEALRITSQYFEDPDPIHAFWTHLDDRFFQRFDGNEIGWISRTLALRASPAQPVIRARLSPIGEGIQVLVYSKDMSGLFARVTGCFERLSLDIVSAKIHTTLHGYALDTFQVMSRDAPVSYRDTTTAIEKELAEALAPGAPLPPPARGRIARIVKHFPIAPQVTFRNGRAANEYELNLVASDRPGLLSAVARVLLAHDLGLKDARISTLGARAEDSLTVTAQTPVSKDTLNHIGDELAAALAG